MLSAVSILQMHSAYLFYAETIEVPLPKRNRIIGAGGHRIKALIAETGESPQLSLACWA